MSTIEGMRINESEYDLANGKKGKIAVFLYNGNQDPRSILDYCVKEYVVDNNHYELIDAQLNCPYVRVVLSNIVDMKQCNFDDYMFIENRKRKLKKLNEICQKSS